MLPASTQNGVDIQESLPASGRVPEPTESVSDILISYQDIVQSDPDEDNSDSDLIADTATLLLGASPVRSTRKQPPLLIALTAYRLLNTIVIISFGTAKAVLTAQGKSAVPTVLDWMLGVVLTIV